MLLMLWPMSSGSADPAQSLPPGKSSQAKAAHGKNHSRDVMPLSRRL
jgi:hypothetical protein